MRQPPPIISLSTHLVTNQPPPLVDRDFHADDPAMAEAVLREAGPWLDRRMRALGPVAGSAEVLDMGAEANRNPPTLHAFDRYGQRLDEVHFHPAYHRLMALAMEHRIHDIAWAPDEPRGRHLGHLALLALFTQAEAGVMCPIDMSYAAVATLGAHAAGRPWAERLVGGSYDPRLLPFDSKTGITIGMAMTEKQGGSDVRANSSSATPDGEPGWFRLRGHKWFCSAPMSDAFLTLANTGAGLGCFLVPRVLPDGNRNPIRLVRLKDKLGNRSNASAEIEYDGTAAILIGDEGRGVRTIIEMVHHTRLGTIGSTLGIMRRALSEALNHVRHRHAFGRTLAEQPLMRAVVADLALEYEAAVLLAARVARAFDAESGPERAFARLAVAVGKYWLTSRTPGFVFECMACHGGVGYVEETPMPRLFRESPLNAIWEGSGNVIALDILRTLAREPEALAALEVELDAAAGASRPFDRARMRLGERLAAGGGEDGARGLAERVALLLQASLAIRRLPPALADAFIATRLSEDRASGYGAAIAIGDTGPILARQPLLD